jgi:hypothetical protein
VEVHELIDAPLGKAVVVEIHERHTPPGLALELHVVALVGRTFALWLLEDGRALFRPEIAAPIEVRAG